MKKLELLSIESKGGALAFLVKNPKLLPIFRKINKKLIRGNLLVKNEKNFHKITIKFVKEPLNLAITICENLI